MQDPGVDISFQLANFPVADPRVYRQTITEDIEAEKINAKDYLYIKSSPLTKPKNTRPIWCIFLN